MSSQNKYIIPATRWQAFIGTLPFLGYGIVNMISEMDQFYNFRDTYAYLAFYGLALTGLLIGWIRGFPLWSYSYLGWALVFAWWWTGIRISGTEWGYRVWLPFGIMVLLALLWTRSFESIKKLLHDIWKDWTRLSLAMFALGSWVSLTYDENHHPQLALFILFTTLVVSAGVWFFLRSSSLMGRVLSILVSFIASAVPMAISYLTWDWRAYYGLPAAESWNDNLGVAPIGILFWALILFWPALIALVHRIIIHRTANP